DRQREQDGLLSPEQIIPQPRADPVRFQNSPVEPERQEAIGGEVQIAQGPSLDRTQGLSNVDGIHLGLVLRPSQIGSAREQFLHRTFAFLARYDAQVVWGRQQVVVAIKI